MEKIKFSDVFGNRIFWLLLLSVTILGLLIAGFVEDGVSVQTTFRAVGKSLSIVSFCMVCKALTSVKLD